MATVKDIELSRLREPLHAMRENMDDGKLQELVESVRELGILQPLRVRTVDDGTFEIVSGHRRYLAAKATGLVSVPCVVHKDETTMVAARVHENLVREDVTPAEEAIYYAELYEELGEDVDRVSATVKRSREYVERRLLLLRGDPAVFGALKAGALILGQAEELNRFVLPGDRAYYLEYTLRGGASIRMLREWRAKANAVAALKRAETETALRGESQANVPSVPRAPSPLYAAIAPPHEFSASLEERECLFCGTKRPQWQMYIKHVCSPCADRELLPESIRRGV